MTNLEAKEKLYMEWQKLLDYDLDYAGISEAYKMAFKALDQEVCRDAIDRQAVLDLAEKGVLVSNGNYKSVCKAINELPPVNPQPKIEIGHCRDCMWWKDSDGVYRRGVGAESLCPINNREVFKGNGYCFMFDPQESEK